MVELVELERRLFRMLLVCAALTLVAVHFVGWHLWYVVLHGRTTLEVYVDGANGRPWCFRSATRACAVACITRTAVRGGQAASWGVLIRQLACELGALLRAGLAEGESVVKCPSPLNVLKYKYDHTSCY
jgi:hypothetical protein